MAEERGQSPVEFCHDSVLRIQRPEDPPITPPQKRQKSIARPTKPTIQVSREYDGFSVLRSGEKSGIEFALLSVTKPIILAGCGWLSVLQGGIRIFGQTMHCGQQPVFAVSAPLAPMLLRLDLVELSTKDSHFANITQPDRNRGPAVVIHNQVKSFLASEFETFHATATIFLITSCPQDEKLLKDADGSPQSDDLPFSLRNTLQHLSLPNFDHFVPAVSSLRISSSVENPDSFEEWASWNSFLQDIDNFLEQQPMSDLRVLVSGPGGSGKSTFARCLSNHLVKRCASLVLLDTDVGQPELNLPGLVAAHHVSELHLGSAIAHIRGIPVSASFLGERTPRDDPDLYEACVLKTSQNALKHAKKQNLPVIINTDGWISGAGSDFLKLIYERTRPSHIVCLTTGNNQTHLSWAGVHKDLPEKRLFYIQRPVGEKRSLYTRSIARELQILAYFAKELCLGRVRAVCVDRISVLSRGKELHDVNRALLFMNGAIVAVATTTAPSSLRRGEGSITGYGLVRGISVERKMAYISSPLPSKILGKGRALVLCEHIHVPSALMLSAASGSQKGDTPPFVLRGHIDSSHRMHSRSSLQRRSTNAAEG